ncbi:hypothetical protein EG327_009607 [Venturia inaequalis]|uniref:Uncharacterized protein n=1 Tax=Venturia inaequalis TaxID=5025 RepID=A0A8H3UNT6_VENIN|nr:hypothetical protein EG327_009607 [Venturia inaequalis]
MAANILDLTRNFSLYTIPAAWILSIAPHFYAASLGGKKFDNKSPRLYTSSLASDQTLDQATKDTIVRAEGAQQNGFENIGLFAAAVVAGNYARLENETLNWLTSARTGAFLSGIGIIFTLFVKSGNAVRNAL